MYSLCVWRSNIFFVACKKGAFSERCYCILEVSVFLLMKTRLSLVPVTSKLCRLKNRMFVNPVHRVISFVLSRLRIACMRVLP